MISIIQQFFIIAAWPYEKYGSNQLNLFNEFAVSASLYILLCLNSQDPITIEKESELEILIKEDNIINMRAQISWSLAILIVSIIFINLIFSFCHFAYTFYRWIKRHCN